MVGRLLSFWEGLFSGGYVSFREGNPKKKNWVGNFIPEKYSIHHHRPQLVTAYVDDLGGLKKCGPQEGGSVLTTCCLGEDEPTPPPKSLTWQAEKSTMKEDVSFFLLKMKGFSSHCRMLVFGIVKFKTVLKNSIGFSSRETSPFVTSCDPLVWFIHKPYWETWILPSNKWSFQNVSARNLK